MSLLHHELGDHEMELALSCMDSHGYITPEQVRVLGCVFWCEGEGGGVRGKVH
jgi:hypothetical protein